MAYRRFIRADEYYTKGGLTTARFGKMVLLRNDWTEKQHQQFHARAAREYPAACADIDRQVAEIRAIVTQHHPLNLLLRCYWHYMMLMLDKRSESDSKGREATSARLAEYVQSIIVSTQPPGVWEENMPDSVWDDLVERFVAMHNSFLHYYVCRSSYREKTESHYDRDLEALRVQLEMLWPTVRGERYMVHQIPYLRDLLHPHDSVFRDLFGISVNVFVDRISRVMDAQVRGFGLALADMEAAHEATAQALQTRFGPDAEPSAEVVREVMHEEGILDLADSIPGRLFGVHLLDVGRVAGLPDHLLSAMSYGVGEDQAFFAQGELSGWPLRLSPLTVRPFFRHDGRYYCFDLANLLDHSYRIVEQLVLKRKPTYRVGWKEAQTLASEELTFRLFASLLPGSTVYRSVYYPVKDERGKTQWCETDGVILFDDHLFVIEVKAGAYALAAPTTDFPTYIDRIIGLVRRPAVQAKRFIDYFKRQKSSILYDSSHSAVGTIDSYRIRQITPCCITIDPFTELAAKVHKLTPMGVQMPIPAWVLSIDDLRVYSEIFDSPTCFAHFVEERLRAASSPAVDLNDELDHLGLYLEHNRYVMRTEKLSQDLDSTHLAWNGYRQKIDYFYHDVLQGVPNVNKPRQKMPRIYDAIIQHVDHTRHPGRCRLISYLLDLSGEWRTKFDEAVSEVVIRQAQTRRIRPVSIVGEANITIFCVTPTVEEPAYEWMRTCALAQLLRSHDKTRLLLILSLATDKTIISVAHEFLSPNMIMADNREKVEALAADTSRRRLSSAISQRGKIGRNDKCPCGSNQKYKRCCGRGD